MPANNFYIIRIESFEGKYVYVRCGNEDQDFVYAIVCVDKDGAAEIIDSGYSTYDEAFDAWKDGLSIVKN